MLTKTNCLLLTPEKVRLWHPKNLSPTGKETFRFTAQLWFGLMHCSCAVVALPINPLRRDNPAVSMHRQVGKSLCSGEWLSISTGQVMRPCLQYWSWVVQISCQHFLRWECWKHTLTWITPRCPACIWWWILLVTVDVGSSPFTVIGLGRGEGRGEEEEAGDADCSGLGEEEEGKSLVEVGGCSGVSGRERGINMELTVVYHVSSTIFLLIMPYLHAQYNYFYFLKW